MASLSLIILRRIRQKATNGPFAWARYKWTGLFPEERVMKTVDDDCEDDDDNDDDDERQVVHVDLLPGKKGVAAEWS